MTGFDDLNLKIPLNFIFVSLISKNLYLKYFKFHAQLG